MQWCTARVSRWKLCVHAGAKAVSAQSEQMRRREEARKLALGGSMAEWKEGKLLPEGWDGMPLSQKVGSLVWAPCPSHPQMHDGRVLCSPA